MNVQNLIAFHPVVVEIFAWPVNKFPDWVLLHSTLLLSDFFLWGSSWWLHIFITCFHSFPLVMNVSLWNLYFKYPLWYSCGSWCLTSAPFQHISTPLCCSPSAASNFTSPPRHLQHPLSFMLSHAHFHSRALMHHSASAASHPPSTFPSLQSHLYSSSPSLSSLLSLSPCVLCCLGHSQLLKKASASTGLCGIAYLVHYSSYKQLNKHNYIYTVITAESKWMWALLTMWMNELKQSMSACCQPTCMKLLSVINALIVQWLC